MKPKYTVKDVVDKISEQIVSNLTPLEIGKILYPDAIPIEYLCVPDEIKKEHLTRYTEKEQCGYYSPWLIHRVCWTREYL